MAKVKRKIAVIDFETDPFLYGRIPKPFAWGFYDGERYVQHWEDEAWTNDNCATRLVEFLEDISYNDEPLLILAHNGGKFDFLFIIKHLTGNIKIVNGRILQANLGNHILRDSYAILPIQLAKLGGKLDIDYQKMERDVREKHKEEILIYLEADCVALYNAVSAFYEEFGDALTIGGASMREFKTFHKFETANKDFDRQFRPYYFGGRCQCFETGIIEMRGKCYDLNSSYPDTMRRLKHPVSVEHSVTKSVTKDTSFVCWEGENDNAVPMRVKEGLRFDVAEGTFWTSIHEFNVGLEHGIIRPHRIKHAVEFEQTMTFDAFIDHFYGLRVKADLMGNTFLKLFYKLILNSSYGKFAQSPDNFKDSIIMPWGDVAPEPYQIEFTHGEYAIWSKPSDAKTFYNVATAASITGGARATLLDGLAHAIRPLYCDTDSIYCESFDGHVDAHELGAWDLELEFDRIAIAGKKMYTAFMGDKCVKTASKGVKLSGEDILKVAGGEEIEYANMVPAFKLNGNHQFIKRRIRRTGAAA